MLKILKELQNYNPYEDFEESINNGNSDRAIYLLKKYNYLAYDPRISFLAYQKRNKAIINYLNKILPKELREKSITPPVNIEQLGKIEIHEDYFQDAPL